MIKTSRILSFTCGAMALAIGLLMFFLMEPEFFMYAGILYFWFYIFIAVCAVVSGVCAVVAGAVVVHNTRLARRLLLVSAIVSISFFFLTMIYNFALVLFIPFMIARKFALPYPDGEAVPNDLPKKESRDAQPV